MSTPERIVHPVHIEDEIKKSYLDYAMSVIIGRALPDVRDGLKPVHRRVLFAQEQQGNRWNAAYKKAARIVGDVIGKYHPHGDLAVYDAIVRLAQDFSMRYPLIDGQGNFGSVDGDPPAAMRYTEVRMSRLASELLADIDKETVDFIPNYDGQEEEPVVLPAKFPNLLVNGSSGIAVGMATNIPPHNLTEVVTATIALIENPEIDLLELMRIVPGPDFPTAGIIQGHAGIRQAYETGRGIIQVRARTEIETDPKRGRDSIVVSELPYQVNKAKLIEKIAELVKTKVIEGISDVRDESDREGMRMVVELKRDGDPNVVLNQLYKHTPLHSSFGIIFLAIVAQQPRILGLKEMLREFVEHRREVVTRRTRYELRKAEERAHILEGLKIALDHLDEVIALIRASQSPEEAKGSLIGRFQFSEIQAQAILDMKLQRLTSLEREKIIQEYEETLRLIARLKEILANDRLLMSLIVEELQEVREAYGDERRTEIAAHADEVLPEDLIPQEDVVVTVSHAGYIKRTSLAAYRAQRRGGKGRIGMTMKEEDFVEHLFVANTHSYIMPFTEGGRSYWLRVHRIPHVDTAGRGRSIVNLLELGNDEKTASLLSLKDFEPGRFVFMATKKGVVKKTPLELFGNVRAQGIIAADVREGDRLFAARLTNGQSEILIGTAKGLAIRFEEADVRPMGRTACGVTGVRLRGDDLVVGVAVHVPGDTILTVTERGYGKRTPIDEYRLQTRGGKGVINIKTTARNGLVASVLSVAESDEVMVVSEQGKILRIGVGDISIIGRATQGVRIMDLDEGDRVVAVAKVVESAGGVEAAGEGEEGAT